LGSSVPQVRPNPFNEPLHLQKHVGKHERGKKVSDEIKEEIRARYKWVCRGRVRAPKGYAQHLMSQYSLSTTALFYIIREGEKEHESERESESEGRIGDNINGAPHDSVLQT